MSDPAITHARNEQLRCAAWIAEHGYHSGVELGLFDWFAEEFLIERQRNAETCRFCVEDQK